MTYTLEQLRWLGLGVTPGEWQKYNAGRTATQVITEDVMVDGMETITVIVNGRIYVDEDHTLIAAAPTLLAQAIAQAERLEKLEEALSWYADTSVYHDEIEGSPVVMVDAGALARQALDRREA
jgi:hypothetical protein